MTKKKDNFSVSVKIPGSVKEKVSTQVVLASLQKKAGPLIKQLEAIDEVNKANYDKAAETLKALKAIGKEADAQLHSIIDPIRAAEKAAKEHFKPFTNSIAELETSVKLKMSIYVENQNRKSMQVLKDFEVGKIKKVETVLAKQAEFEVSSESASVRKLTRAKAVDVTLTPREYLIPDERAILDALKSGKKVKGWELETVNSIAI